MNILVISQYFWPENFRINELVGELVRRGHQVTVLTGIPNYPNGEIFKEYQNHPQAYVNYQDAKIIRVPMLPRGTGKIRLLLNYLSFALSGCIIGAWKLRGQPFDVIFTFEPSPITVGIPSAFLRRLKRAPQAFWVLDLWPETLQAIGVLKRPWMLNIVGLLVQYVYRHCDLILAQSKSFVSEIRRYSGDDRRIEYFPSWTDAVFFESVQHSVKELTGLPPAFTVLFAGNIGEAQDFPAILDAAEYLKHRHDIRWVIVGDGRKADWVKTQISERGLTNNVLMLGRHPLERMPAFFAHADALLVSLKDEPVFAMTIPGKMQSYLAAGIPILAMLNGEGARIILDTSTGLACGAGDSHGLADNVIRLIEMTPTARKNMGDNGKRLCEAEFERNQLIDRLEKWLQQLASQKYNLRDIPDFR